MPVNRTGDEGWAMFQVPVVTFHDNRRRQTAKRLTSEFCFKNLEVCSESGRQQLTADLPLSLTPFPLKYAKIS